ncbi:MAG: DUF11 domain-containing protein [Chloroflexi bacterium]|nr:DUF11 domain-containing protein [Chloroflexota bacterium]
MKKLIGQLQGQKGTLQLIVMIGLSLGVLFVVPFVSNASTHLLSGSIHLRLLHEEYATEGAVEYAIWRLLNEEGFADSLTEANPEASFFNPVALNQVPTFVIVTRQFPPPPQPEPPSEEPIPGVEITAAVNPKDAVPGVATIFTYTIYITNLRTDTLSLDKLRDYLPLGFHYVPGSSSGVTTGNPTVLATGPNNEEELVWTFSAPRPPIGPGQVLSQTFQASAVLDEGTYWDSAQVKFQMSSPNKAFSGPVAPVRVSAIYDISAVITTPNGVTIRATIKIVDGVTSILSWQVE